MRPKQMAMLGTFYMHEAILDFLYQHYTDEYGVGAAETGESLGIYRLAGRVGMNDAIVTGFLNQLFDQGKVAQKEQPGGKGGWALSAKEFESRQDHT